MKKIIFPLVIISVATYILAVIIAGFFKEGYSQLWNTVSILTAKGESTRSAVVTVSAITYLSLLVITIYSSFVSTTKTTKVASQLLIMAAVFSLVQLFLPMDPWQGFRTNADKIHDWITVGIAVSIISSIFLFAAKTKGFFRKISFCLGGLVLLFAVLSGWFLLSWNFYYLGLFERLWILSFLAWIIFFSYHISRNDKTAVV
ncbi:MAG: DUF998 domain-containing protein [Patescibacteria group bacterium]